MGPKRGYQRKGNTSTNNQTDNTDNTATDDAREWDGKPFDEVTWYSSNLKMLYNEVAGAREYCTSGLIVSDKKVSVISVQRPNSVPISPVRGVSYRVPCSAVRPLGPD